MTLSDLNIAVLIPCYNEAITIAEVIKSFQSILPNAIIYVYDNNSSDDTYEIAKANNAIVRREYRLGKGYVVRRMFADIEADVYLIVDGDTTYDAKVAPKMIETLIEQHLDIVIGTRITEQSNNQEAFAYGHKSGNQVFAKIMKALHKSPFTDVCSGYRAMSRRFVKSFAAHACRYEIEAELSIHTLELGIPYAEVPVSYSQRPAGSHSKLRYFGDGMFIFYRILGFLKYTRPLFLFTWISILFIVATTLFAITNHFDSAKVCGIIATSSCIIGLILDNLRHSRQQHKRQLFINLPYFNQQQK